MKRRKMAVIGLGDIAEKAYLPVIGTHPEVEITGIMSRTEATAHRIGELYRIGPGCTDLSGIFRTEPEAVFVHTPTETHYGIVMECLRQGLHVYVDKPLSYDIRESAAMAEQAVKSGRLLAVGFNRRFAPLYVRAKAWLEEAGGFELCSADKHRTRLQRHNAKHTLYDDLIHMIDLLVWLAGSDCDIGDFRQAVDGDGRLRFAAGSLRLAEGAASFSMARGAGADLERLELHGGGRSAQVVNLDRAVLSEKGQGSREEGFGSWDSVSYRRGFTGVVEHFLESLDRPEACSLRAEEVLQTHRLVEKLSLW